MMSSTPRETPPSKSPALKRGATALRMMILEIASVSVPLEPVADLDPHPVLLGRYQKQHAIVLLGFAELPLPEEIVGVGLDLLAAEGRDGRNYELNARLLFQRGELAVESGAGRRREDARLIDDAAGERGEVGRRPGDRQGRGDGQPSDGEAREKGAGQREPLR